MRIHIILGEHLAEIVTDDGNQIGTMLNEAAIEAANRWNHVEDELEKARK